MWGLVTSISIIVFPLMYLIITAVVKIHGHEKARDLILFSIFANLIVSFIIAVAIDIPGVTNTDINIAFNTILDANIITTIASVITYFVAGVINIQLIDRFDKKLNLISLIIIVSGIAVIVDVVLFNLINSITTQSFDNFSTLIFNRGIPSLIYIVILSPLFYYFINQNKETKSNPKK